MDLDLFTELGLEKIPNRTVGNCDSLV